MSLTQLTLSRRTMASRHCPRRAHVLYHLHLLLKRPVVPQQMPPAAHLLYRQFLHLRAMPSWMTMMKTMIRIDTLDLLRFPPLLSQEQYPYPRRHSRLPHKVDLHRLCRRSCLQYHSGRRQSLQTRMICTLHRQYGNLTIGHHLHHPRPLPTNIYLRRLLHHISKRLHYHHKNGPHHPLRLKFRNALLLCRHPRIRYLECLQAGSHWMRVVH